MRIEDVAILVTGASSGIGLDLCKELLEKGAEVIALARGEIDIEHPSIFKYSVDIRNESELYKAIDKGLAAISKPFYGLINNAGLGRFSPVENCDSEDFREMMETNVFGMFYCTKKLVPVLKSFREGHIINISSVAGLHGIANGTAYCASKFAVRGFSHSLFKELRKDNIKVSCIYPGSVATAFFDEVEGVDINSRMLKAEDVARRLIQELESPPNTCSLDIEIRALATT